MRGDREVEGDPASLQAHEEDPTARVLAEGADRPLPLCEAHAPHQLNAPHPGLRNTHKRLKSLNE